MSLGIFGILMLLQQQPVCSYAVQRRIAKENETPTNE